MLTETHRAERGHDFYPPADQLAAIPPTLRHREHEDRRHVIHLHYLIPGRATDWWIAELDPATGLSHGYARLAGDDANAEWGYLSLPELEALHQPGGLDVREQTRPQWRIVPRILAERDPHWTPCTAAEADLPGVRAAAP